MSASHLFCRIKKRPVAWKTDCERCEKLYYVSREGFPKLPTCDFNMVICSGGSESDVDD